MKQGIAVFVIGMVILCGAAGIFYHFDHASASAAPPCTAGPGEQCPNAQFSADYQAWKDLQTDIQKLAKSSVAQELTRKNDQWTGMRDRLAQQVPAGYTFDDAKLKFIMNKPQPAAPPQEKK